jgi:hypothetical protein
MDSEWHSAVLQSSVATSEWYKKKDVSGIALPGNGKQQTDHVETMIMEEFSTCCRLICVSSNMTHPQ